MKRINVRVYDNDDNMALATYHPLNEAKRAKNNCDRLSKTSDDNWQLTVSTVSTDAVAVYEHYGRVTLGLDVHFYLNDEETDIEGVFESFNQSLDYIGEIAESYNE